MYGLLCQLFGSLCALLCGGLCRIERSAVPIDWLGVLIDWSLVPIARFIVLWAANPCPARISTTCRILLCGRLCQLIGSMCRRSVRPEHAELHGDLLYGRLCQVEAPRPR